MFRSRSTNGPPPKPGDGADIGEVRLVGAAVGDRVERVHIGFVGRLPVRGLYGIGADDVSAVAVETLDSLEFGGVRLTRLSVGPFYIRPLDGDPGARLDPEARRDMPDLLIGADVLKRLRLFVAQDEKVIYLTPSGG